MSNLPELKPFKDGRKPASAVGARAWVLLAALKRDRQLWLEYARWFIAGRGPSDAAERRTLPGALSLDDAHELIRNEVGHWSPGAARALVQEWHSATAPVDTSASLSASRTARSMAGDPSLGELVYGVVRALRPVTVIETGVATGITSAYVLAGLLDNKHGFLDSVDLPPSDLLVAGMVGAAVPIELRTRWRYHWGSTKRLLPDTLSASLANRPRIFIHDSDHTAANMRWELDEARRSLSSGDWIIADDVDLNEAFRDFSRSVGGDPVYVAQRDKPGTTGILRLRE